MSACPTLLCIVGPTASGKTALAVGLALHFGGEIVSCDSMQIYRGMDIGTAKPTTEERHGVTHHMIDCASPFEPWSAGTYAREATKVIEDIRARGRLPILCGGTGLYLRALTEGLSDIPDCPAQVYGPDAYERLTKVDPVTAARLTPSDRQRITRALDVFEATGIPLSEFHRTKPEPRYQTACLGLGYDRETLYARINARTRSMLDGGLIEETQALLSSGLPPDSTPLRAIGYRETMSFLLQDRTCEAENSRTQLEDAIAQSTRRYAKRQMTWFAHQTETEWANPSDVNFFGFCTNFVEKRLPM